MYVLEGWVLQGQCANTADVAVRKVCLLMPLIKSVLYKAQFALAAGVLTNIKSIALQAANNIASDDKGVLPHVTQYALPRHAA